jgi:hypothetical protein
MPKDGRTLKRIKIGGSSESTLISTRKMYRVKIDGKWHEGRFSMKWFGWLFEGDDSEIQLNLIDEVYEIVSPPARKGRPKRP